MTHVFIMFALCLAIAAVTLVSVGLLLYWRARREG